MDTNDNTADGTIARRGILTGVGATLMAGLGGCLRGANKRSQTGSATAASPSTHTAHTSERPTRSNSSHQTAAENPAQTSEGDEWVATTPYLYLRGYEYIAISRRLSAYVYNPTSESMWYSLQFYLKDENGYTVYYEGVDASEYVEPGYDTYFEIEVPEYVAFYEFGYKLSIGDDVRSLFAEPGMPDPNVPWDAIQVDSPEQHARIDIRSIERTDQWANEENPDSIAGDVVTYDVTNISSETIFATIRLQLKSDGGVTIDEDTGHVFPLQPGQSARLVSDLLRFGVYESSSADIEAFELTLDEVYQLRLPPTTGVFDVVAQDTINGFLEVEVENTTNSTITPWHLVRWFRDDIVIGLSLWYGNELEPGASTTTSLSRDLRTLPKANRATDYDLVFISSDTAIESYDSYDNGPFVGLVAPFES